MPLIQAEPLAIDFLGEMLNENDRFVIPAAKASTWIPAGELYPPPRQPRCALAVRLASAFHRAARCPP